MKKNEKKRRIAVLFEGDIEQIRGEFTAIHNRVKELKKDSNYIVDVFVFKRYYSNLICRIKKITPRNRPKTFDFDGINYRCFWYKISFVDFISRTYFKNSTSIETNRVCRFIDLFKGYDLLYTNSLNTGILAFYLKCKQKIPFISVWHGSSIHTFPFKYNHTRKQTIKVLENADMNFFVSEELYELAQNITPNFEGKVSFNGVDTEKFRQYNNDDQRELRKKFGIDEHSKCIAFVGNCLPVKNVAYLPELFTEIYNKIPGASFYILGNGHFSVLFKDCKFIVKNVEVLNTDMPLWYNCMDLIVMPSHKEGLPMTCLEATACGTSFVGARVGAIADVVGNENTILHDDSFNQKFAALCIKRLQEKQNVMFPDKFVLSNIVYKEKIIVESLLKKYK